MGPGRRRVYVSPEAAGRIFPEWSGTPYHIPILCPAFIPALASLSPQALARTKGGQIRGRGWTLDCSGLGGDSVRLGPLAVKTLLLAFAVFTARPHRMAGGSVAEESLVFSVSAWDVANLFGISRPEGEAPNYQKTASRLHDLLYRILEASRALSLVELVPSSGGRTALLSECAVVGGSLEFKISQEMGTVLAKSGVARVRADLFRFPPKERTAFALWLKMTVHASIRRNHAPGVSWDRLRVRSLLEATPLPLDLKAVGESGLRLRKAKSWRQWTQHPFKRAMGLLLGSGILSSWEYSMGEEETDFQKLDRWLEAVVVFSLSRFPEIEPPKKAEMGDAGDGRESSS